MKNVPFSAMNVRYGAEMRGPEFEAVDNSQLGGRLLSSLC